MTIPVWPSDLPQRVTIDGFSSGVRDGRLFAKMDRGPSKLRRLTSAAIKPQSCAINATIDDCARIERFWREDLKDGSLPFLFPSQLLDSMPLADPGGLFLQDPSGVPIAMTYYELVVFAEGAAPHVAPQGGMYFTVSFQLNLLP